MINHQWLSDVFRESQIISLSNKSDLIYDEITTINVKHNLIGFVTYDIICSDFKKYFGIFIPNKISHRAEFMKTNYNVEIHSIQKLPANILDFKFGKNDRVYDNDAELIIRFDENGNPNSDDPHNFQRKIYRWTRGGAAIASSMILTLLLSGYIVRNRKRS